jgi:hypothetical protein
MSEIDHFVLPDASSTTLPVTRRAGSRARPRIPGNFLRGPIPWLWIQRAHTLGGNALAAGLALRMFSGINRGREFPVSLKRIATMTGVSQGTVRRAVQSLADARLITVTSTTGRRNTFQIVEPQDSDAESV